MRDHDSKRPPEATPPPRGPDRPTLKKERLMDSLNDAPENDLRIRVDAAVRILDRAEPVTAGEALALAVLRGELEVR